MVILYIRAMRDLIGHYLGGHYLNARLATSLTASLTIPQYPSLILTYNYLFLPAFIQTDISMNAVSNMDYG